MKNLCKQNWYQITLLFLFCVTVFLRFYKLTVLPKPLLDITPGVWPITVPIVISMYCLSIRRIFTVVKALSILTLSYC